MLLVASPCHIEPILWLIYVCPRSYIASRTWMSECCVAVFFSFAIHLLLFPLLFSLARAQNAVLLVLLLRYTYACLKHNLGRALPECHDMDESDAAYLPYTPFGGGSMDASGNYGFASVNGARPSFDGPALTGLDGSGKVAVGAAAAAKNSSPSASSLARKQTHMIGYLQEQVKTLSLEILRLRSAAEFRGMTGAGSGACHMRQKK